MPWKRKNNPFDSNKPKQRNTPPATMVTVACHSADCMKQNRNRSVNIRVETEDNGVKFKHCRDCQYQWEVRVSPGGAIQVWQSNQFGAGRQPIPFEKVWQGRL